MSVRLSIDIGGTFTDVVLDSGSVLTTTKVLTTYDDPARGVILGIDEVLSNSGVLPQNVTAILHGTTLATNALIERRGAATGLLTTAGHRDVLEMAFENRFEQYDVNIDRPIPLVPRHWRLGIEERIAADGEVLVPLNEVQLMSAVEKLVGDGVESIAIGFLHSYIAGQHERAAADIIRCSFPSLALTLSSEVCPEIREYERFSTTVANAYVMPLMSQYLHSLSAQVGSLGIACQVLLMTSGGGLTTLQTAAKYPIRLVESGPAGGAMLAANIARSSGLDSVLSFDMGGTTAKICLIENGEPLHSRSFEVDRSYRFKKGSGLPVRIPVIEMVEIGAGGGSIAQVDAMMRLQVGPASAGSQPGPASYGKGGQWATVTDADVVLGKLSADHFAGGKLRLDSEAARRVVEQHVGNIFTIDSKQGAHAISEIVEENMASAARAHAAEWGKGLRNRCMIAFGGAAPLHAASLATKLKIPKIIIPQGAGVGSALGFLLSPISFEVVRSLYMKLQALDSAALLRLFNEMRNEAMEVLTLALLGEEAGEKVGEKVTEKRQAFMRYVGQGYEVAVDVTDIELDSKALRLGFEQAYKVLYGRIIPGMQIEVLSWTLSLSAAAPKQLLPQQLPKQLLKQADKKVSAADAGFTEFYNGLETCEMPIYQRDGLKPGFMVHGPVLIVEDQTSTVVPGETQLTVLKDGALCIDMLAFGNE